MNKPAKILSDIPDIQSSKDTRHIPIDKVGIKNILHPIVISDRSGGEQHTVARFNMYVNLPDNFKGTHMSRFVEILNQHEYEITVKSFKDMIDEMAQLPRGILRHDHVLLQRSFGSRAAGDRAAGGIEGQPRRQWGTGRERHRLAPFHGGNIGRDRGSHPIDPRLLGIVKTGDGRGFGLRFGREPAPTPAPTGDDPHRSDEPPAREEEWEEETGHGVVPLKFRLTAGLGAG